MTRSPAVIVAKVRRVVWIPFLTTTVAVVMALGFVVVSGQGEESYESELLVLVPATPPPSDSGSTGTVGPGEITTTTVYDPLGRPTEALRAAANYAEVIPQDSQIRDAVAAAAQLDEQDVSGRIGSTAVPDSSLIVITFEAPTAAASEAGIQAIEAAIIGDAPATPAISPRSLIVVSTNEPERLGGGTASAVASAAVLGFALGVFLAFAWARSNARVDGHDDLIDVTDAPVIEFTEYEAAVSDTTLLALLLSLESRVGESETDEPLRLAVVGVDDDSTRCAARATETLLRRGQPASAAGELDVLFGGRSGTNESAAAALFCAGVALAVERGGRVSAVREAISETERLGCHVDAVLVLPPIPDGARTDGASTGEVPEDRSGEADDEAGPGRFNSSK